MRDEPTEVELLWEVSPFREDRAKGLWTAVVIMASVYFATRYGGLVLGLLAVLVLVGGTGPFFVTTRYRLTDKTVEVRSPFQRVTRPWGDFRRVHVGRYGVTLSPFAKRHFLEPYRSVMLRFGDRDQVLGWVRRFGPQAAA